MRSLNKYVDNFSDTISKNKLFIGLMTISVVIGSKFIIMELPDYHVDLLNNKPLRRFFAFGVFFMATRDIYVSLILTIIFAIFMSLFIDKEILEKKELEKIEATNKDKDMKDKPKKMSHNLIDDYMITSLV